MHNSYRSTQSVSKSYCCPSIHSITHSLFQIAIWRQTSLVSRSFLPSVFDRLWYAKTERGKVWEKESRAWRHVDMRVDMRVAVPDRCNSQTLHWSAMNLQNNKLYWRCLSNVTFSSSWTKRTSMFFVGHRPSCVYPHVYLTSCTWLFLPGLPPFDRLQYAKTEREGLGERVTSVFAYCKRSKTGGRNDLGTRLEADTTYQECLPSCELHSHDSRSLTESPGVTASKSNLRMQITQPWDCAHVVIMRSLMVCNLEQSQDSENAQHNLEIARNKINLVHIVTCFYMYPTIDIKLNLHIMSKVT